MADQPSRDPWTCLHDAVITLITCSLQQDRARVVTVEIRGREREYRVCAEGFTHFAFPQERPWGLANSVFINEARHTGSPDGERLVIETQEGDDIVITAPRISLETVRVVE